MTNDAHRTCLKLAALLLHYPDRQLIASLSALRQVSAALDVPQAEEVFTPLIAYLERTPLLELQQRYTARFDLDASTSLNLTHHLLGEDKRRGALLAELQQLYVAAGVEPADGELPDSLPALLELATLDAGVLQAPAAAQCLSQIAVLAGRLSRHASPYAGLVEALTGWSTLRANTAAGPPVT